jgi:hypothetical protein
MFVFWIVTRCRHVNRYQLLGGTYCLHLQGSIFLQNVDIYSVLHNLEPTYYYATAVVLCDSFAATAVACCHGGFHIKWDTACLQVCTALQPRRLYLELPWIPTLHLAGNDTVTEPASDGRLLSLGRA